MFYLQILNLINDKDKNQQEYLFSNENEKRSKNFMLAPQFAFYKEGKALFALNAEWEKGMEPEGQEDSDEEY